MWHVVVVAFSLQLVSRVATATHLSLLLLDGPLLGIHPPTSHPNGIAVCLEDFYRPYSTKLIRLLLLVIPLLSLGQPQSATRLHGTCDRDIQFIDPSFLFPLKISSIVDLLLKYNDFLMGRFPFKAPIKTRIPFQFFLQIDSGNNNNYLPRPETSSRDQSLPSRYPSSLDCERGRKVVR